MGKEDYKNEKKGHGFLCVPKELLFDNRYKQLTIEAILLYWNGDQHSTGLNIMY